MFEVRHFLSFLLSDPCDGWFLGLTCLTMPGPKHGLGFECANFAFHSWKKQGDVGQLVMLGGAQSAGPYRPSMQDQLSPSISFTRVGSAVFSPGWKTDLKKPTCEGRKQT